MGAARVLDEHWSVDQMATTPRLALVPTGADVPVPGAMGVGKRWQLTRRGRMLRSALVLSAVILVVAVAWSGLAGAAEGGDGVRITVQPGQTLSELAVVHLPHLPLDRAVVEIQVANQLSGSGIYAGQELVLP